MEQAMRNYLVAKGETINLWETPDIENSTTIKPTGSYPIEGIEFEWEEQTVQIVFIGTSATELNTRIERIKKLLINAVSADLIDGVVGFRLVADKAYMGKDTKARMAFTTNWIILKNI